MAQHFVTGTSQLYAVFGNPSKGSQSPAAYNTVFGETGIDAVFVVLEALETEIIPNAIRGLQMGGGTVTTPFKQEIMKYLDEISEDAQTIGAVNVVVNDSGRLVGHNTDWIGALNALKSQIDPRDKSVALLGAGGAARGIAFALSKSGANTTIFNRNEEKAENLCSSFAATYGGTLEDVKPVFDITINATSIGFGTQTDLSPITAAAIREGSTVFDIVARPKETQLIKLAKGNGCEIVYGFLMGAYHGEVALELLTGVKPPIDLLIEQFGV